MQASENHFASTVSWDSRNNHPGQVHYDHAHLSDEKTEVQRVINWPRVSWSLLWDPLLDGEKRQVSSNSACSESESKAGPVLGQGEWAALQRWDQGTEETQKLLRNQSSRGAAKENWSEQGRSNRQTPAQGQQGRKLKVRKAGRDAISPCSPDSCEGPLVWCRSQARISNLYKALSSSPFYHLTCYIFC